eukprot:tig00000507_g1774.t1
MDGILRSPWTLAGAGAAATLAVAGLARYRAAQREKQRNYYQDGVACVTEMRAKYPKALINAYVCDVTNRAAVRRAHEKIVQGFHGEGVTILVNNAGVASHASLLDTPDESIERTMAVNATAHFWTVKCCLPEMLRRASGHIVSIASAAGLIGVPGMVDYCASKFAAVGLMEALRLELRAAGAHGVECTTVCPFFVRTALFPGIRQRFFALPVSEAPDIARAVARSLPAGGTTLCLPAAVAIAPLGTFLRVSLGLGRLHDAICDATGVGEYQRDFLAGPAPPRPRPRP